MTKVKRPNVEEQFVVRLPLFLMGDDPPPEVRKFIAAAGREVAAMIITHWAEAPADYDVDIEVTMRKRKNLP